VYAEVRKANTLDVCCPRSERKMRIAVRQDLTIACPLVASSIAADASVHSWQNADSTCNLLACVATRLFFRLSVTLFEAQCRLGAPTQFAFGRWLEASEICGALSHRIRQCCAMERAHGRTGQTV
jgi:hypothetical protein